MDIRGLDGKGHGDGEGRSCDGIGNKALGMVAFGGGGEVNDGRERKNLLIYLVIVCLLIGWLDSIDVGGGIILIHSTNE